LPACNWNSRFVGWASTGDKDVNLKQVQGSFAVAQLPADAPLPDWLDGAGLTAFVRSDDELTLVCEETRIPQGVTAERGWACFRSVGPFAFDEAGIVAALVSPISAAGIGVFVLCTFDGEHILCPVAQFQAVQEILTGQGHSFVS
jgi:hypothetical protein